MNTAKSKSVPYIDIKPFDRTTLLNDYFRMTILGSSNSGKTYYVRELLPLLCSYYNRVFIFTQEHNRIEYDKLLKEFASSLEVLSKKQAQLQEDIEKNENEAQIKKTLKKMGKTFSFTIYTGFNFSESIQLATGIKDSNYIKLTSKSKYNYGKEINLKPYKILIIFDDVISNKSSKDDDFLRFVSNCRHAQTSLIYLSQYLSAAYLNEGLKNNMTHIVLTKGNSKETRHLIKRDFLGPTVDAALEDNDNDTLIKETRNKLYNSIFNEPYTKLIFVTKDNSIYIDI